MNLLRTFHTVRYLRPVQITNRIGRRVLRPSVPPAPAWVRLKGRKGVPPCGTSLKAFDGDGFTFLNRRWPFEGDDRWCPAGADRLWIYHLHYFQYIWGLDPGSALGLILDWLDCNPPLSGPGWEPYPLSLRIREWIEWLLAHQDIPEEARLAILQSLARQTRALLDQVEYHLQANHLLENAVTLVWAGLRLDTPDSRPWLQDGARLLLGELDRQILPDGVHEERSPMYQAILAEGLLRLADVARDVGGAEGRRVEEACLGRGRRMLGALGALVHPDGGWALLNDCTLSGAASLDELVRQWDTPRDGAVDSDNVCFPDAGYFGMRKDGFYLVMDAGSIGPDHQPGHGHADALSFEMSNRGRRVFTDTGTFTYEEGPERAWDRGTAAHNTLTVDGRDQSELWSAFRCGRRIQPLQGGLQKSDDGGLLAFGGYAGPGRFLAPVVHRRSVRLSTAGIAFADFVKARGTHRASLHLHLAPGLSVKDNGGIMVIKDGAGEIARVKGDGFGWAVERSPYHPDFGVEVERACLTADLDIRDTLDASWHVALS